MNTDLYDFAGKSAIIISTPAAAAQLIRQIRLLPQTQQPLIRGVMTAIDQTATTRTQEIENTPVLGEIGRLEHVLAETRADLAFVSLPAVMTSLITAVRTHLRRLGVAERFVATLQDQLAGIGPRSLLDVDPAQLIDRPGYRIQDDLVRSVVTGRRVLITGAGGSIGSELARIIARYEPSELLLMDRSENSLFEIDRQIARRCPGLRRAAWLHDVTESSRTLAYCLAARPEVIFHAAAHKHVPMMEDHPALAVRNNLLGTKAIADAAAATRCERFVMVSTDKAVNPASVMGATKRLAEWYIQHMNRACDTTRFSMVRFGNVLASAGSVLTIWEDQIREGGPLTVTHPDMTRYFMTIPEAAALVIQAAAVDAASNALLPGDTASDIYVLDMGAPVRILDLARRFILAHGLEPLIDEPGSRRPTGLPGSISIRFTGTRPGEKLHEELAYDAEDISPTTHPGIHVRRSVPPPAGAVIAAVSRLTGLCDLPDTSPSEVTAAIAQILPEWRGAPQAPPFPTPAPTLESLAGILPTLATSDRPARVA